MKITELKGEAFEQGLKTMAYYLKGIDVILDLTKNADRHKAVILAENLRIKFNEVGGLGQ